VTGDGLSSMTVKKIRNILGGFLFGFGWMTFFCLVYIDSRWTADAPRLADPANGLVYAHNVHGTTVYLSSFQSWAVTLLSVFSIPVSFMGFFILPKRWKNSVVGDKLRWKLVPEEERIAKYATFAGIIFAPAAVYFAGPAIVRVVMSLPPLL